MRFANKKNFSLQWKTSDSTQFSGQLLGATVVGGGAKSK